MKHVIDFLLTNVRLEIVKGFLHFFCVRVHKAPFAYLTLSYPYSFFFNAAPSRNFITIFSSSLFISSVSVSYLLASQLTTALLLLLLLHHFYSINCFHSISLCKTDYSYVSSNLKLPSLFLLQQWLPKMEKPNSTKLRERRRKRKRKVHKFYLTFLFFVIENDCHFVFPYL